jgi:dimethylargininase
MFTRAIVRTPGRSMVCGLTNANLGPPDYARALVQHRQYIAALQSCGLEVLILDAEEAYPDSTFIEDAALLTPQGAVMTRPAAPSRRGETIGLRPVLECFYRRIEAITAPGTLDGGDVLQVGQHFYIGLSGRTNRAGAEQLIRILAGWGMSASTVPVARFLHLKTGVTGVAEQTLLATGEFVACPEFSAFTILPVARGQTGAANCIALNGRVLMPAGFPRVRQQLAARGLQPLEVDISEFAKLNGGLTCLSLRF